MNQVLAVLLEIVKVTLPALVVFATVYYLFKTYLENDRAIRLAEMRNDGKDTLLPLRLQAYERLVLFCERISLSNLIARIRNEEMTAADLKVALMVAVQQEYEHNVSQQIYVSDNLWKIITFAKNDTINVVNIVSKSLPENASGLDFSRAIFRYLDEVKTTSADTARSAIREELAPLL